MTDINELYYKLLEENKLLRIQTLKYRNKVLDLNTKIEKLNNINLKNYKSNNIDKTDKPIETENEPPEYSLRID